MWISEDRRGSRYKPAVVAVVVVVAVADSVVVAVDVVAVAGNSVAETADIVLSNIELFKNKLRNHKITSKIRR